MDHSQLLSFVTVAQTLNFTSAARRNGVPQSTVSRQIDALEEQLGAQLFYRTRRQVQLTEEGRTFLPYAREILEGMQKGTEAVRQLHQGEKGVLRLAAVSGAGQFLTGCLQEFSRQCPHVAVELCTASGGDGLPVANEDPFDFHFLARDMADGQEEYDILTTHTVGLTLLVSRQHPMVQTGLQPEKLAEEQFLLISEKEDPILYMQVVDFCQSMRFTPRIAGSYDSVEPLLISVAAGLGAAVLPVSVAAGLENRGLAALPLDQDVWNMTYVAAWKRSLLNPSGRLFLEILRRRAEQV